MDITGGFYVSSLLSSIRKGHGQYDFAERYLVNFIKNLGKNDTNGRATDNSFIERFFRSIKYDYIYLNPAKTGVELYQGIKKYIEKYNNRKHQGVKRIKPICLYNQKQILHLKSA